MDVTVLSREEDVSRDEIIEPMIKSAIVALKLGMYEDGMARFEEILECGTSNFKLLGTIYMWYGRVCRKLKHHERSLDFFEHELNIYKLTSDIAAAYDASRRIAELSLKLGKFSKAKRTAEEFLEYTTNKKGDSFVQKTRILLASVCLEGFQQNLEQCRDEKQKLLTISSTQLEEAKLLSGDASDITIMMLEAKLAAMSGRPEESREAYQKCIDFCIKSKNFSAVHRAYYEMATFAGRNFLLCIIHDLRSALIYATKYGTDQVVGSYKIELAKKLLLYGSAHEAYILASEALAIARKQNSNSSTVQALLVISQCLITLRENRQAAYFLVAGSIMAVKQEKSRTENDETDKENQQSDKKQQQKKDCGSWTNCGLEEFYTKIDPLMTAVASEQSNSDGSEHKENVQLAVDGSVDHVPDELAAKFVVKLEHTTTLETWRIAVTDVIGVAKQKLAEKKKKDDEEPLDFMDLIAKMNNRMDDQRTELPAAMFNRPRPLSSASSRKTIKSHRILPGLRANFARLPDMIDRHTLNKLMKRSKKSKVSLHSNSTQGDDTRSDVTIDDSILTTSK